MRSILDFSGLITHQTKKFTMIKLILLFTIFSCLFPFDAISQPLTSNKNFSKNEKEKTLSPADTSCIYQLNADLAQEMMRKFNEIFRLESTSMPVTGLTKEFFIEKCVFVTINNFLEVNPKLDGIRFHMGGNTNSQIVIVATSPVVPPSTYYQHTNRWDIAIPLPRDCYPHTAININLPENIAKNMINDFGYNFRGESIYGDRNSANIASLSSAIWMDRCVIAKLSSLLINATLGLDGMLAYSSAYLGEPVDTRLGQQFPFQSTLIFVPSKMVGSKHEPQWDILKSKTTITRSNKIGAANHSQLCPQICN